MGISLPAFAFPTKMPFVLPQSFTAAYEFEGIVALSNCSGSVIRFENSKSSDKALILTNGHCNESGLLSPGEFVSHKKSSRTFALLKSTSATKVGQVKAEEIVYGTMTGTD